MRKPLEDVQVSEVTLLAFIPTDAPPGSDEKIEILTARATIGLPLFHRGDNRDQIDSDIAVGRPIGPRFNNPSFNYDDLIIAKAVSRGASLRGFLEGRGER